MKAFADQPAHNDPWGRAFWWCRVAGYHGRYSHAATLARQAVDTLRWGLL